LLTFGEEEEGGQERVMTSEERIHTGMIGIWQPEAGLNKHTHIHKHEMLGLQIKHIEECYWRLVNA